MAGLKLTATEARALAVRQALLAGRPRLPEGKNGAARVIEHMGYVQVDTISRVERAHHHVLWSRVPSYRAGMLEELQTRDRQVFEYWSHAACYLPMKDYRFYRARMRTAFAKYPRWETWREANRKLLRHVRDRIRTEGPLGAADFADEQKRKRGSWWDWKPAKTALESLHMTGELMVTQRRNFQRIFDLCERVLPSGLDLREPGSEEMADFVVRRSLQACGTATLQEVRLYLWTADREDVVQALARMTGSGEVVPVRITGSGEPEYALRAELNRSSRLPSPAAHILSPFDNLIANRARTRRVFGFDYELECYKPAAQRRHGYFVLPVLWRDKLVARLDCRTDRAAERLEVLGFSFEPGFRDRDEFLPGLNRELRAFAEFNRAKSVRIRKVKGLATLRGLERELRD